MQEFIKEAREKTSVVLLSMVGGAAVQRQAASGDFRSNIHLGA